MTSIKVVMKFFEMIGWSSTYFYKNWYKFKRAFFKPIFYRRYVDHIFVLFKSTDLLEKFRNYFNTCHPNISFSSEKEKNGKMSFLDVEISRETGKFVTTVYLKPNLSGFHTHFESFFTFYTQISYALYPR